MDRSAALDLLSRNTRAMMATVSSDGSPHVVPVLYALDGEQVLISGTDGRVRTRNLEADPRCSVAVIDGANWFSWVTAFGEVEVRRDNAVEENLRLYKMITGSEPENLGEYRAAMAREKRLIYAMEIKGWYPTGA